MWNEIEVFESHWEIENDKVHWKLILNSADDFGPIFHLDFSENITGSPKYEVQSAHFNKSQFSLHVSVAHETSESNRYYYHFSDDNTHDFAFTGHVARDLIEWYDNLNIMRFNPLWSDRTYMSRYMLKRVNSYCSFKIT